MTKITVVAQAPYPVPITSGRHLTPGEIAVVEHDAEVESQLTLGFLRRVHEVIEVPSEKEETAPPARKPRASQARDDNQED